MGENDFSGNTCTVKPYPNPTAILGLLGLHRLKRILDKILYFPSRNILYVSAVKNKLYRRIENDLKNGRIVSLITCVPPHDISLIGLYFKEKFPKIKWIIDWQDLWSYDEYYLNGVDEDYRQRLLAVEKSVMHACDVNVVTNYKAEKVFVEHYGIHPGKVTAINHAYDNTDLFLAAAPGAETTIENRGQRVIKLGFLGTLSKPPKVSGERILHAVDDAVDAGIDLEFNVYGDVSETTPGLVQKMKNKVVKLHDRTSHDESLRNIAECDLLVISLEDLQNSKVIMHGKLPHYLALRKPIIAMVPEDSFVAEVVGSTGTGVVIPTSDDWGKSLTLVLQNYLSGETLSNVNSAMLENYSWSNISELWKKLVTAN